MGLTPLVYPPLLADESPLAPLPYPLPGSAAMLRRFGSQPAGARTLCAALKRGEHALVFPGGAREVFKRKGEEYEIFWGDDADIVRLAARCNATIVPFSGLGGDESFAMAGDSQELMDAPAGGAGCQERGAKRPADVEGDSVGPPAGRIRRERDREEEETEESKSRVDISYAVFCLKKKTLRCHITYSPIYKLLHVFCSP